MPRLRRFPTKTRTCRFEAVFQARNGLSVKPARARSMSHNERQNYDAPSVSSGCVCGPRIAEPNYNSFPKGSRGVPRHAGTSLRACRTTSLGVTRRSLRHPTAASQLR